VTAWSFGRPGTDDNLADIGGDRDRMLDTLAHRCDPDRDEDA
jgi:hypothetical protein